MPAISSIRVTLDASAALRAAVDRLVRREVAIGVPDSAAERRPAPGESKAPSNALLGYVHEFGAPEHNIPARPFLMPGIANAKDDIVARLRVAGAATLTGDAGALDNGLMAAGIAGQNAVRAKITDGPFAPLSDRTIAARASRGRSGAAEEQQRRARGEPASTTSARPLVDTGQLRAAITYVVRDKGAT